MPSLLQWELETNPFLRADADPELRAAVGLGDGAEAWQVYGALRARKDGAGGRLMHAVYPLWDRLPLALARAIAAYL